MKIHMQIQFTYECKYIRPSATVSLLLLLLLLLNPFHDQTLNYNQICIFYFINLHLLFVF